ncbi:MAG: hypothetical protein GY906_14910, partial [bacterium]|nr:hypothetical protein [bacterium]
MRNSLLGAGLAMLMLVVGCGSAVQAPVDDDGVLGAGFRYSVYGPSYDPGPGYWASVGRQMAGSFE